MLDSATSEILEPVLGATGNIQFAVGIVGRAVFAGLVVVAGSVNLAIVLGDVKVDGPWTKLVRHLLVGGIKLFLGVTFLQQCVLGSIVTESI